MKKQPFIPIDLFNKDRKYIEQTVPSHLLPFWFTFGKCTLHAKKCVKIWAENWDSARVLMNGFYGVGQWAFQYDSETWMDEEGKTRAELHGYIIEEIKSQIKE